MSVNKGVTQPGPNARVIKRPYIGSELGIDLRGAVKDFVARFTQLLGSKSLGEPRATQPSRRMGLADKHIAITENAIEELNRQLQELISSHRHRRNQDSPIYQLPTEVLVRIFFHSLHGLYGTQFSHLHKLAQVSVVWSQLVKGSPELFGFVTTSGTAEDAYRSLRLSKDGALDIHYHAGSGKPWKAELLETLLCQTHRWRSIKLSMVPSTVVNGILAGATPKLSDIRIKQRVGIKEQIRLGRETAGRLCHLTLEAVTVRWDPRSVRGPKTLELDRIGAKGRPSLSQLLEILRASDGIQVLRLAAESVADAPKLKEYIPIELPQLTTLSLTQLPLNTTYGLLRSVRIPNCSTLVISCRTVPTPVPTAAALFKSMASHVEPTFRSILRSISSISITQDKDKLDVHGVGDGVELKFEHTLIPHSRLVT
ncbi:hypothetical protein FRB95_006640 [Tulasnella sp. JGI-2019a]|nr:hypothetical protein FRB95_006640 [Tulasnella sp. JGI-2019a]